MPSKTQLSGKRLRLYEIVFESDTPAGRSYDITLLCFIVASVAVVSLESVSELPLNLDKWFLGAEWFFTVIFTADYILRIWIVSNKRRYIFSFFGIIDLLSILPTYLALFFVGAQ